jgi:predicted DNA-binding transcriptional regulator AlpA
MADKTMRFHSDADGLAPAEPLHPILLTVEKLAELLSISVRSVWRLQSAHRIPEPMRLAGSVRWRLSDIQKWVDAGCPPRENSKKQL